MAEENGAQRSPVQSATTIQQLVAAAHDGGEGGASGAETPRREAHPHLTKNDMKTLLDVDDGSSVTFYCRCGRRAREAPRDDYQTGIEFYCRKHGWVATWREEKS